MPRSANAASSACGRLRRRRDRHAERHHQRDRRTGRSSPRAARWSCTSSAVSLGAGGHLNGVDVTPTTTRPPSKRVEHVAEREGAGHRVELVARLDQPGVASGCEVGAQRDHQDVGVEGPGVGLHAPRHRVDRRDGRLHEPDAGLGARSAYAVQDVRRRRCGRTSRRAWRSRRRSRRPGRPARRRRRCRARASSEVASSRPPKPAPRIRTRIRGPLAVRARSGPGASCAWPNSWASACARLKTSWASCSQVIAMPPCSWTVSAATWSSASEQ